MSSNAQVEVESGFNPTWVPFYADSILRGFNPARGLYFVGSIYTGFSLLGCNRKGTVNKNGIRCSSRLV